MLFGGQGSARDASTGQVRVGRGLNTQNELTLASSFSIHRNYVAAVS